MRLAELVELVELVAKGPYQTLLHFAPYAVLFTFVVEHICHTPEIRLAAGTGQSCLLFWAFYTLASWSLVKCTWLRTWLCYARSERPQQFSTSYMPEVLNESLSSDLLRILPLSLHFKFPRCAPPQEDFTCRAGSVPQGWEGERQAMQDFTKFMIETC